MASHRVLLTNYLRRKALISYSLKNSDFGIPTLTLLTMENILLDIKNLIYGRNYIIN